MTKTKKGSLYIGCLMVSKKSTPFRQRLILFKPLTRRHKYKTGAPSAQKP